MSRSASRPAHFQAVLDRYQGDRRLPSVVAGVLEDGRLTWTGTAGAPTSSDTQHRIGSITKTITALLVLQCRDGGLLSLDDRLGVLQDIHWSTGAFGYFPTYALGTILAAQLWDVFRRDTPDVEGRIEAGDLGVVRDWLADKVHRHGKRMTPSELIVHATGRPLDAGPYLAYARGRAAGSTGG